jgi:hypothetical protein
MAEKSNCGLPVNDGNGLMDDAGFIDSLILDCNNAIKQLASGNYVSWCNIMVLIVNKLAELKKGILKEKDDMRSRIAELQSYNAELNEQLFKKEHE